MFTSGSSSVKDINLLTIYNQTIPVSFRYEPIIKSLYIKKYLHFMLFYEMNELYISFSEAENLPR